ncbi:DUF2059 domain-containing protein [Acinetobacter lanii]|uniref:DUF2059 domain-containing protein n=1 Tax=Acinetobacter lanii TaxID=2715163 RepID=A0A6G8S6S6_9GAMM|nr:DUF2059 domain-containing protein [Acinetobacter lanii]QIO09820.1 DUF2059 domain-containing protein [Acinetobacter lanii]
MKITTILSITLLILINQKSFAKQATEQSVNQLIQVMNINSVLQETLKQIRPQMDQNAYVTVKSIIKHDQLSPQEQIVANELADQMYQQSVKILAWEQMKPIYEKVYREVYSGEEVQAQIDFYSSEIGQSILRKSPLVAQESMKIINTQIGKILQTQEKDLQKLNLKLGRVLISKNDGVSIIRSV